MRSAWQIWRDNHIGNPMKMQSPPQPKPCEKHGGTCKTPIERICCRNMKDSLMKPNVSCQLTCTQESYGFWNKRNNSWWDHFANERNQPSDQVKHGEGLGCDQQHVKPTKQYARSKSASTPYTICLIWKGRPPICCECKLYSPKFSWPKYITGVQLEYWACFLWIKGRH